MEDMAGRPRERELRAEFFDPELSPPDEVEAPSSPADKLARLAPDANAEEIAARFAPPRGEPEAADSAAAVGGLALRPKFWLIGAALVAALLGGGAALAHYLAVGRFIYSTDDAYVQTDMAIIAPQVSGYVEKVEVVDNQHVKVGQVLAEIDPGDYRLAVAAARDRIGAQDATIARIKAQLAAQDASVAQAQAQLDAARAEMARAKADLGRIRKLAAADFASKQRFDRSLADRDKAAASVAAMQALLAGAKANLIVLKSQIEEATRERAVMDVALARAKRNLSFTEIRAPFDGIVGNRAVQPGQFAQPGEKLMALAPDGGDYVRANFKETDLDRLAPGEKAKVSVDALDGKVFHGVVQSIAPASGAEFSLLPPENATGNFTKITQRFPVRIRLPKAADGLLRAGMSVVVDVDTRRDPARH